MLHGQGVPAVAETEDGRLDRHDVENDAALVHVPADDLLVVPEPACSEAPSEVLQLGVGRVDDRVNVLRGPDRRGGEVCDPDANRCPTGECQARVEDVVPKRSIRDAGVDGLDRRSAVRSLRMRPDHRLCGIACEVAAERLGRPSCRDTPRRPEHPHRDEISDPVHKQFLQGGRVHAPGAAVPEP